MTAPILGIAPYLTGSRPRAAPRFYTAEAEKGVLPGREPLRIDRIGESAVVALPASGLGLVGLAAPGSLPRSFLRHLEQARIDDRAARRALRAERGRPPAGAGGAGIAAEPTVAPPPVVVAEPAPPPREPLSESRRLTRGLTVERLLREARSFAGGRLRGDRFPRRRPDEPLPALDRLRLPLFLAAAPLFDARPLLPWCRSIDGAIVEVEPSLFLAALGAPASGLSGDRPDAVRRRLRALEAVEGGAAGFPVTIADRELAIAAAPALDAVVAAVAAAWAARRPLPATPDDAVEAWWPLPAGA